MNANAKIDGYAYGKFSELVDSLFCDVRPAREKLLDKYEMIFIIAADDFKVQELRDEWSSVQKALQGKVTNRGSERNPQESITVRNTTLERVLRSIWNIHCELHEGAYPPSSGRL